VHGLNQYERKGKRAFLAMLLACWCENGKEEGRHRKVPPFVSQEAQGLDRFYL